MNNILQLFKVYIFNHAAFSFEKITFKIFSAEEATHVQRRVKDTQL